jgi:hypothetical protein
MMSSHREVIIELTKEQQNKIKEKLGKDVSFVKLWLVPGTVILAEAIYPAERFEDRKHSA